jgi:UDP-N-acetylglucosamine 2-epimerase (non-hydrolysing)
MKKKICIVSGSRADYGLLEWPIKVLSEDDTFDVEVIRLDQEDDYEIDVDLILVLGDRLEIMELVLNAHIERLPIAHIAGGDVTEGSYDDAMRDCISRMSDIHFVTSTSAMARLTHMGCTNVHLVGNPGVDYIKHADWKEYNHYTRPYVVINYQAETIDGTNEIQDIIDNIGDRWPVFILPNPDSGSDEIIKIINENGISDDIHDEYLNLIYHCDELIGNSSSMLYEAPELEVKTRMIGKRQRGRTIPWGDGFASKRMLNILKYTL